MIFVLLAMSSLSVLLCLSLCMSIGDVIIASQSVSICEFLYKCIAFVSDCS